MAAKAVSFLDLPTELRLPIYRLVLPYSICDEKHKDTPVRWFPGQCPSILFVCRRTYQEAAEILYAENTFAIYIRHPQWPRLPWNDSHRDLHSFAMMSSVKHFWAHPKQSKFPLPQLQCHQNLQDLRKVYISLPPLDGLLGVNYFFISRQHWVQKPQRKTDDISPEEDERMAIVQRMKDPLDEIGDLLTDLPNLETLSIGFAPDALTIAIRKYMLERLLRVRGLKSASCFVHKEVAHFRAELRVAFDGPRSKYTEPCFAEIEHILQSPPSTLEGETTTKAPTALDNMQRLEDAIRWEQYLDAALFRERYLKAAGLPE